MPSKAPTRKPRTDRGRQRRQRLLTAVKNDREVLFKDRRCRKPDFCEDLFELCDGLALEQPQDAIEHAEAAVRLTEETGDRHLKNRALGVLVHAHIARTAWDEAEAVLDRYQEHAFACCAECTSDYLRRRGDFLVETHRAEEAQDLLDQCLREMDETDEDRVARARFVRCISFHFQRDPERALRDVGQALMELSFESPRGYFLDSLAFVACFLRGAERRHLKQALDVLLRFKERIKGVDGWTDVRTRLAWVEGAVHAALGHQRRAADRLERGRLALMKSGPVRHAVAIAIDECMLMCRRLEHENNLRALRRMVATCLRELDLDQWLRRRLEKLEYLLVRKPEKVHNAFRALRRAMVVTVPGLL